MVFFKLLHFIFFSGVMTKFQFPRLDSSEHVGAYSQVTPLSPQKQAPRVQYGSLGLITVGLSPPCWQQRGGGGSLAESSSFPGTAGSHQKEE